MDSDRQRRRRRGSKDALRSVFINETVLDDVDLIYVPRRRDEARDLDPSRPPRQCPCDHRLARQLQLDVRHHIGLHDDHSCRRRHLTDDWTQKKLRWLSRSQIHMKHRIYNGRQVGRLEEGPL